MTRTPLSDAELDEHLRRTLRAVAATVDGDPRPATARPRRRRRGILAGLGAVAIGVPVVAAALYGSGPEYVDKIPPDNVIVAGSADGSLYWMVESFHTDECGKPVPGVELVAEEDNILGREWNTFGYTYGEPREWGPGGRLGRCGYDVSEGLADPAMSFSGGSFVDDTFVPVYAVHPDVTALRVTTEDSTELVEIHPVDGAGYAVFEVAPEGARYTVELLIGDQVVPGSRVDRTVPER